MIFSLVKGLFKWVEVLSRRVITLLGSETDIIFEMGHLRKKVLNTLSNFELEKYSCAVSWKGIFSLVKDLFKWIEVLSGSVIILVLSEPEIIFDIGHLRKKVLNTLSNFEPKNYSIAVSWKVTLSCQGAVQMRPKLECHNSNRFWNRDNIWYRSSTKKVLNTLSNFEHKKYSCAILQFHENWFSVLSRTCSNGLRS